MSGPEVSTTCSTTGSAIGSATGSATGSAAGFDFGPGLGPGRGPAWAAGRSSAADAGDGVAGACAAGAVAGRSTFAAGACEPAEPADSVLACSAFRLSPCSLRKRISAGSSMVELADLTNSPISLNFSRTNLLSTPNSLASSWTRVLATL